MTPTATSPKSPRVFISYSHTSEDFKDWVLSLATRLRDDGIDIVIDVWDLEHGQDLNSFMERMVNDANIVKVIVLSDLLYAEKADGRKAGVGTETQIISAKVYRDVAQTKFIPVVCELDADNKPCLPTYLASRKWINFTDRTDDANAYDELLRAILERPSKVKPALGTIPSHLQDGASASYASLSKCRRFHDVVVSGRGNATLAFQDASEAILKDLEALRLTYSEEQKDSWYGSIKENLRSSDDLRNAFVSTVLTGGASDHKEHFIELLLTFFERLLPFTHVPESTQEWYECSVDNYRAVCYEWFLYAIAALIKTNNYKGARMLIDHGYVAPTRWGGSNLEHFPFTEFNQYARSLEGQCANKLERASLMADLIHDRATNQTIRFVDLMQADGILMLASPNRWFPRTFVYSSRSKLELFLRAEKLAGFAPLGVIFNIATPRELVSLLYSDDARRVCGHQMFWRGDILDGVLNGERLRGIWSTQST